MNQHRTCIKDTRTKKIEFISDNLNKLCQSISFRRLVSVKPFRYYLSQQLCRLFESDTKANGVNDGNWLHLQTGDTQHTDN